MKFKGVTPSWRCVCAGNGVECSEDRARWPLSGFWSDVCQAHMDAWFSKLARALRNPWTGRLKEVTE